MIFLVSGNKDFLAKVANSWKERYDFGRIEEERFKYTGINIQQQEDKSILIDQIEYIKERMSSISSNSENAVNIFTEAGQANPATQLDFFQIIKNRTCVIVATGLGRIVSDCQKLQIMLNWKTETKEKLRTT